MENKQVLLSGMIALSLLCLVGICAAQVDISPTEYVYQGSNGIAPTEYVYQGSNDIASYQGSTGANSPLYGLTVSPEEKQADLNISKSVTSPGPYHIGDEVKWIVTVWNNGPSNATNITITEDVSHLGGLKNITAVADLGDYNTTTKRWNIGELANGTFTTLTLNTTFSTSGKKINRVDITALNEMDPVLSDNHAKATVQINASDIIIPDSPVSANLVITPKTLNLKSNGVFTVYVTLKGITGESLTANNIKPRIDSVNSTLTCSGAEMIRMSVSNKDGGTLIAKFRRQDLVNVTAGDNVQINCSGTLTVDGKTIDVEGSDTIRVIGEKSEIDKIFSRLLKFLGLEKDDVEITEDDNGNVTLTVSFNLGDFKNLGQIKKTLKTADNKPGTETDEESKVSKEPRVVKDKSSTNDDNDKQIKENGNNRKTDKDDKNGEEQNEDNLNNKSNGKGKK